MITKEESENEYDKEEHGHENVDVEIYLKD